MCGIFAAFTTTGLFTEKQREMFVSATDSIAYRGPDARGVKVLNTRSGAAADERAGFNVFLGHRRLSILDLSANGHQPMKHEDYWIVYNGEIFNYVELRDELRRHGCVFSGESDTEVILKTYQTWGEKGFERFNGMWAFVLLDMKKQQVICSRDRFSIKPLYYYRDSDTWFFASEIKQLLPFLSQRNLNHVLASQFLIQQLLEHTDSTLVEGIHKVPSKSNLIIALEGGKSRLTSYWDFSPTEPLSTDAAIYHRFHELLDDSVRIRMRSDVKVGALLSGGLDSSAITVLADKFSPGRFGSFSVVSNEAKYSEEKFIDALVGHHPLPNVKLRFEAAMIPDAIDKVLFHQDQPFGSLSVVAQYLMFQLIRENSSCKVILSGQGGDEVMLGYLKYYFFNLQECKRKRNYKVMIRELLGSLLNRTVLWQLEWQEMKRYIPSMAGDKPDFLLQSGQTAAIWDFESVMDRQKQDIDRFSVPVLAHYEDRNSMAASIESRLPFLDHRLVDFLLGLPVEMKMRNGWPKYVLRKSIHELPDSIRWRRDKKGFITPETFWLKNQLVPMVKAEFTRSGLHDAGFIDKAKFLRYYDEFLAGKPNRSSSLIFRTYIFEKWYKQLFV